MQSYRIGTKRPEIFSDLFLDQVFELNDIVRKSGAQLEGNIFYKQATDFSTEHRQNPIGRFRNKRINLFLASLGKSHFVEIGFNAGHSTLLILASNPTIRVSAIDICINPYTQACAKWMTAAFPGRFDFYQGDSQEAFPQNAEKFLDGDLFHVDGGHSYEVARSDIENVAKLENPDNVSRHLIIDDIVRTKIETNMVEFVNRGFLQSETYGGRWREAAHVLLKALP